MENFGRAKSQATEIKMTFLTNSLQLFYIDVGRYPTEAEGLSALSENPGTLLGWSGPYIDSLEDISDPWGRDFLYTSPAENKPFEIKTLGRDGIEGGEGEDADVHL
jgi:general secretion pathway protein G